MKWSWVGRAAMGLLSAMALGLGMTACGTPFIAYIWTISSQNNKIIGYQVDNNTGNLTVSQNSPYSTNGTNPVSIVVKPGGRYVYVVNQGTTSTSTANDPASGIAVFSVGGDGALTFQQSYPTQGYKHLWIQFDGSGNYLFALDQYSPSNDGNGAITTFSVDPNTGRLELVTQTGQTPSGGVAPNYVEVGANPVRMLSTGTCLYTVNQGNSSAASSITPFIESTGQLNVVTTGTIAATYQHATSINGNSTYVIVTDAGTPSTVNGVTTYPNTASVYAYNVGSTCGLTSFTASLTNGSGGDPSISDPVFALLDNSSKYLYILNGSVNTSNPNNPYSQISAYNIVTNQLTAIANEPFVSGSGPTCMVEDPSSKYMYASNLDGTITGYFFDNTRGELSALSRGSKFNTGQTGLACLALSGAVAP